MKQFGTVLVMLVKEYVDGRKLSEAETNELAESIRKIISIQQTNPNKHDGGDYVFAREC